MTDGDWQRLVSLLANWWPGEWTPERDRAYRIALDAFAPADVLRALEARLRSGDTFRPSAAELVAAIVGTTGEPAGAALALVEEASRRVNRSYVDADFHERHQAAIEWLAERDPAIAWWAARRGICQMPGAICQEPMNDPERGGIVRASLAKEYGDVAAQVRDRVTRGLPPVPEGALTARRRTALPGSSGVMDELRERLRPAHQLEPGADDGAVTSTSGGSSS